MKKTVVKSVKKPAKKKAAAKKRAPKKPSSTKAASMERGVHPKLTWLIAHLKPGRYAGGLLQFSPPGTHANELGPWLRGRTDGRTSIGRTAFGELLVFRDLREHATSLGMEDAETACDVAAIDIHFKRMKILATSAEEFVALLDDAEWQKAFLRKPLYLAAKARVGDWEQHECFGFVPALALGGREQAASVERVDWRVYQALLLQM
ncbi:MAG: DUF1851 domain-containing protein [Archangium sp.]|nr:DUF1851 domain-containing protein [Archangium sp.]MDP3153414.1 DUF1851 domain-containing protein [Archangium sp.]MDP3573428.1 DUF1851 domain-containing protein [Archangium sp.]